MVLYWWCGREANGIGGASGSHSGAGGSGGVGYGDAIDRFWWWVQVCWLW